MDAVAKTEFEQQSRTLRTELKTWENEWTRTHSGAKPGKNDIKKNPDIERKYMQYGQIRDILSGKAKPPASTAAPQLSSSPQKRKSTTSLSTPSKRTRHIATPSKRSARPDADDEDESTPAISRTLFSPALPSSIGPTPQRDGKVLGLFDMLSAGGSPSASALETPSRKIGGLATKLATAQAATPSRKTGNNDDDDDDDDDNVSRKGRRTPMSTSKRQLLDTFLTPLKKGQEKSLAGLRTPSSQTGVSELQFDTPAFLRRAPPSKASENDVAPLRLPRKPMGRTLSSIVAGLRKIEEDALDDELEAMREMEAEEMGVAPPSSKIQARQGPTPAPTEPPSEGEPKENGNNESCAVVVQGDGDDIPSDILAQDRQVGLLGGFDDEGDFDGPVEQQFDRNGQPLKVYKKKGQKRTTRLHKMKPVQIKRPTTNAAVEDDDSSDEVIPETQEIRTTTSADVLDDDLGSEFEASGQEDQNDERSKKGKTKAKAKAKAEAAPKKAPKATKSKAKPKAKKADDNNDDGDGDEEEEEEEEEENGGTTKKSTRKVSAMAHANFRRLKLRNSGSKGGPGYNSRFRRRR